MAREQPVVLERMPQQYGLLGAEDDWTGVTSSAERRRVQNRINQRAYRKRKQNEARKRQSSTSQSPPQVPQSKDRPPIEDSSDSQASETEIERYSPQNEPPPQNELWALFYSAAERAPLDRHKMSHIATICGFSPLEQKRAITEFQKWICRCQELGSPQTDHLLILVKFNVFRALVSNSRYLGYPAGEGMDDDDALSPFTDPSNPKCHLRSVPAALRPTKLQRQIPHHPWIDVLPVPEMRDNLLRAGDSYDDMALCADLIGFYSESRGRTGMIVWGEPWDISGWEITESFVKQWGWTIRGSEQLLRATNYWRERRGERPLRIERILNEDACKSQLSA